MSRKRSFKTKEGEVNISNTRKSGGDVLDESKRTIKGKELQSGVLFTAEPMGEIHIGLSETINIGNYESLRLEIGVTLPTLTDEDSIKETKDKCAEYVDAFMTEEKIASGLQEQDEE